MNIKRKIIVKLAKLFMPKAEAQISKEERCLMIIVHKLLVMEDTVLEMKPNMSKLYVRKKDKSILVIVDTMNNTASIINHKFKYDLKLTQRTTNYVVDIYSKEADKRRNDMEAEFRSNVQNSLTNVINNIDYETHTDCQ